MREFEGRNSPYRFHFKLLSQLRITVINSEQSYYSYLVFGHLLHLTLFLSLFLIYTHTSHTLNRMPMMTFLDKYLRIYTRNTYLHIHIHTHTTQRVIFVNAKKRIVARQLHINQIIKKIIIGKYFYKKIVKLSFFIKL